LLTYFALAIIWLPCTQGDILNYFTDNVNNLACKNYVPWRKIFINSKVGDYYDGSGMHIE